jgi:hypothetical protein
VNAAPEGLITLQISTLIRSELHNPLAKHLTSTWCVTRVTCNVYKKKLYI